MVRQIRRKIWIIVKDSSIIQGIYFLIYQSTHCTILDRKLYEISVYRPISQETLKETIVFIEKNAIEMELLTGPMLENCNGFLTKGKDILLEDCELAMDVFDVLSNPKIIESKFFGASATSSCISVLGIVITSMALKVSIETIFIPILVNSEIKPLFFHFFEIGRL